MGPWSEGGSGRRGRTRVMAKTSGFVGRRHVTCLSFFTYYISPLGRAWQERKNSYLSAHLVPATSPHNIAYVVGRSVPSLLLGPITSFRAYVRGPRAEPYAVPRHPFVDSRPGRRLAGVFDRCQFSTTRRAVTAAAVQQHFTCGRPARTQQQPSSRASKQTLYTYIHM